MEHRGGGQPQRVVTSRPVVLVKSTPPDQQLSEFQRVRVLVRGGQGKNETLQIVVVYGCGFAEMYTRLCVYDVAGVGRARGRRVRCLAGAGKSAARAQQRRAERIARAKSLLLLNCLLITNNTRAPLKTEMAAQAAG